MEEYRENSSNRFPNSPSNMPGSLGRSGGVISDSGLAREPELSRVLTRLHNLTDVVHQEFSLLNQKLEPILSPDLNEETLDKAISLEFSTPLAQSVNEAVKALDRLIYRIVSVRSKIEL